MGKLLKRLTKIKVTFDGVLITIAVTLVICVILCGATMFLYPRIAGEWLGYRVIPVPPFSEVLIEGTMSSDINPQAGYTTSIYTYQTSIYHVDMPLIETRNWFARHFPMLPLDNDLAEPATSYRSRYVGMPRGNEYLFLTLSAALTLSPTHWDTSMSCFSVEVFTKDAFESSIYFEHYSAYRNFQNQLRILDEDDVIAVVKRCWPAT